MKNIKEHADELRTMAGMLTESAQSAMAQAAMLNEAADGLDRYHDEQVTRMFAAMGLSIPVATQAAHPSPAMPPVDDSKTASIRTEWAELPPVQRTVEKRQSLARRHMMTVTQVDAILQGPVRNGSLTRR